MKYKVFAWEEKFPDYRNQTFEEWLNIKREEDYRLVSFSMFGSAFMCVFTV